MELFKELFFTLFFALFFSLVVAKLVSVASRGTDGVAQSGDGGMGARRGKESGRGVEGDVREVLREGSADADVAVERRGGSRDGCDEVGGVLEEAIVEHFEDVGGDGDRFESLGAIGENLEKIGVDDVEVEGRCVGGKLEEFDDVDDENGGSRVYEEKIVERVAVVDCATVEDVGSVGDSLESLGAIGENTGKIGVEGETRVNLEGNVQVVRISEEMIAENLRVDDAVFEDVGGDGGKFESLGTIGENIEQFGVEDDIVSSDHVVDDELEVEEMSEGKKMGEFVENIGTYNDIIESSGANDEKIESIGVVNDIIVNLGRLDTVVNEVALEEKSDESKLKEFQEKIVEHVGAKNVSFEYPGASVECIENAGVGVDEDDDWEGIERSELEENFAAAADYVFNTDKSICDSKLDNNVKMELYGLHKVALEGPCREGQPMAIMVSARAKWNAWQKLGNMSPDIAMEQYITLLSDKAPEWMQSKSSVDGSKYSSMVSEASPPDIDTYPENQLNPIKERVNEPNSATIEDDLTGGSISTNMI